MIFSRMMTVGASRQPAWNPLDKDADISLSSGDLVWTAATLSDGTVRSRGGYASGKRWVQMRDQSGSSGYYGVATAAHNITTWPGNTSVSWAISYQGQLMAGGVEDGISRHSFSATDMIDLYLDISAGKIWYGLNGVPFSGSPAAGTGAMQSLTPGTRLFLAAGKAGSSGVTVGTLPLLRDYVGVAPAGFTKGW